MRPLGKVLVGYLFLRAEEQRRKTVVHGKAKANRKTTEYWKLNPVSTGSRLGSCGF